MLYDETATHDVSRTAKELVHRSYETNVFVAEIRRGDLDTYESNMVISLEHEFFFEHAIDHVPGLMLVEGVRQLGTAVSHVYYGVPISSAFVLNNMVIDYTAFAELHVPVVIHMRIHDVVSRGGRVAAMQCASTWMQAGKAIGTMDAKWSIYEQRTMARIRAAMRRQPSMRIPAQEFVAATQKI